MSDEPIKLVTLSEAEVKARLFPGMSDSFFETVECWFDKIYYEQYPQDRPPLKRIDKIGRY